MFAARGNFVEALFLPFRAAEGEPGAIVIMLLLLGGFLVWFARWLGWGPPLYLPRETKVQYERRVARMKREAASTNSKP